MYVIIPHHYKLFLSPDFNDYICSGSVRIDARAIESVSEITLNAVGIEFKKTIIHDSEGEIDANVSLVPEKQEVRLHLPRSVKGNISIIIDKLNRWLVITIIFSNYCGIVTC